jgi:hypothetical protein
MSKTAKPAVAYYAALPCIVESSNTSYLHNTTGGREVFLKSSPFMAVTY